MDTSSERGGSGSLRLRGKRGDHWRPGPVQGPRHHHLLGRGGLSSLDSSPPEVQGMTQPQGTRCWGEDRALAGQVRGTQVLNWLPRLPNVDSEKTTWMIHHSVFLRPCLFYFNLAYASSLPRIKVLCESYPKEV